MIPRIAFDSANSFDKPIDFDIEVSEDDEIQLIAIGKETIGGNGKASQFTKQFIQETIDLSFNWMSQDIYEQMFFWAENFGLAGDTFRYFPDGTDLTRFFDCILLGNNKTFNPSRSHPNVVNFKVKYKARVVDVSAQILTDRLGFYP